MFRNSGKKIMGLVNFIFYLHLVLTVVAAVLGTVYVYMEYGEIKWLVLAAVGCLLVGTLYMVLVYFALLFFYAFGELVQSSVDTRRILAEGQRASAHSFREQSQVSNVTRVKPTIAERKAAPSAPAMAAPPVVPVEAPDMAAPAAPAEAPAQAPREEPARPTFAFDRNTAAGAPGFGMSDAPVRPLFCSKCGAKHDPGTASCRYCGTPLG